MRAPIAIIRPHLTAMPETATPAGANLAPAFQELELPGQDLRIELSLDLADRLYEQTMLGFDALPHRGAEVGGVLLGAREETADGRLLRLLDFEPAGCDYAYGPSYLLGEEGKEELARLVGWLAAQTGSPLRVVGFYRSHTRQGLYLTGEDLDLFDHCFPGDCHLLLLIRPEQDGSCEAGLFLRRQQAVDQPLLSFPLPHRETVRIARRRAPASEEARARIPEEPALDRLLPAPEPRGLLAAPSPRDEAGASPARDGVESEEEELWATLLWADPDEPRDDLPPEPPGEFGGQGEDEKFGYGPPDPGSFAEEPATEAQFEDLWTRLLDPSSQVADPPGTGDSAPAPPPTFRETLEQVAASPWDAPLEAPPEATEVEERLLADLMADPSPAFSAPEPPPETAAEAYLADPRRGGPAPQEPPSSPDSEGSDYFWPLPSNRGEPERSTTTHPATAPRRSDSSADPKLDPSLSAGRSSGGAPATARSSPSAVDPLPTPAGDVRPEAQEADELLSMLQKVDPGRAAATRRRSRAIIVAFALLAAAAGAWLGFDYGASTVRKADPPQHTTAGGLGLSIAQEGPELRLRWDLASAAVLIAERAELDIQAGAASQSIALTAAELRTGSFLFMPQSGEGSVRLQVFLPGGKLVSDSRPFRWREPPEPPSPAS